MKWLKRLLFGRWECLPIREERVVRTLNEDYVLVALFCKQVHTYTGDIRWRRGLEMAVHRRYLDDKE